MSLTSNDPNLGKVKIGNGLVGSSAEQDIVEGSSVQIQAIAESGASFQKWSDNNTNATRTVTVNSALTLQAVFIQNEPVEDPESGNEPIGDEDEFVTLTLRANVDFADTPTGGGTFVKGATTFISAAEEATDPSKSGNEAVFTFSSWSDGVTSRERNIVLDSDMTLTANYTNPYSYGDE